MNKITLKVKGMMCEGCENRIKNSLSKIKEIKEVDASYKKGCVTVTGDDLDKEKIKSIIKDLDFEVM